MRAHDIAIALAHGPFPYRRYVCVPNLSWGLLTHEADFAAMAPSRYLYEVEIKISIADLKRDALKRKHRTRHLDTKIRGFWYAMPRGIWEKIADEPPVPDYAGIIVINHLAITYDQTQTIRRPRINTRANPLSQQEAFELGRLGVMRYWSRTHTGENAVTASHREQPEQARIEFAEVAA